MKKNSFTLLSTLILVFIFSILIIKIFEVKSISSINIVNQYKYIQAKNHLDFLENYIYSLDDLDSIDKIKIINKEFDILAFIKKDQDNYQIELIVKDIKYNIRVHKKITKLN